MINKDQLYDKGYYLIRGLISDKWLTNFHEILPEVFAAHRKIQVDNNSDVKVGGLAFHAVLSNPLFIEFLDNLLETGFISVIQDAYFKGEPILNSFSALDNLPGLVSFASRPHRDVRCYTSEMSVMLNMLIMLDDFTEHNGATLLLSGSHKEEQRPTDEFFFKNATKIIGKKGDVLLFNSNMWHAAGFNTTDKNRKALALTFTESLIKQLLDYPRAFGSDIPFNEKLKRLLGYSARVPASLEEWYQPSDKRFYKN